MVKEGKIDKSMSATITIFNNNIKKFVRTLSFEPNTPEYIIADEAYRLFILIATPRDHFVSDYEMAEILKDFDYDYNIKKEG